MANDPTSQTWQSGDWSKRPNSEAPYNGIEISGLPEYDENGMLISVAVTLTDYTLNKEGVASIIPELTVFAGHVDIIAPIEQTSPPSSPLNPSSDFTIKGWVSLEPSGANVCLRIHLRYGLEHLRREEIGYVMCFDLTTIK